jgi:hypothetical protein
MAAQLAAIAVTIAGLPNVQVALLPLDQQVPVWHSHGFTLFDQPDTPGLVHLEMLGAGTNLRDPEDVARFATAWEQLAKYAVTGSEAVAILERLSAQLRLPRTR